jgi:hypothetical protein
MKRALIGELLLKFLSNENSRRLRRRRQSERDCFISVALSHSPVLSQLKIREL